MKRIIDWITQWDKDKVLHFTLSLVISLVAACITRLAGGERFTVMAVAWFAGFAAGVLKEIADDWRSDGSDSADWAADVLGTTLAIIITYILAS